MSELLEAVTQTEGDVRGLSFFGEDLYGQRMGHVEFEVEILPPIKRTKTLKKDVEIIIDEEK